MIMGYVYVCRVAERVLMLVKIILLSLSIFDLLITDFLIFIVGEFFLLVSSVSLFNITYFYSSIGRALSVELKMKVRVFSEIK